MNLHVQYLTDTLGTKTAVQIPYEEWELFLSDYKHLSQCDKLKHNLETAFREVEEIQSGKRAKKTLTGFLNER